jgi:hypothetical protein
LEALGAGNGWFFLWNIAWLNATPGNSVKSYHLCRAPVR